MSSKQTSQCLQCCESPLRNNKSRMADPLHIDLFKCYSWIQRATGGQYKSNLKSKWQRVGALEMEKIEEPALRSGVERGAPG